MKTLFIDRDGTLIVEPEDFQVDALEKLRLVDGVIPAMLKLREAGFRFVMISNQDGLGTESFPEADFHPAHDLMMHIFSSQGIDFDEVFICPHLPGDDCDCRKPRTGLLTRFLASNTIDIDKSAVIGDRDTDLDLAERIGVRGFKLDTTLTWDDIVEALTTGDRTAEMSRKTNETSIELKVNLDSSRSGKISTGIGFFDHMLEQISKHGGFRLDVACSGDLDVDEHHTVEDVAITLGTAMKKALGDKIGIGRYGFVVPMDESEARVSVDLSGRGNFLFTGEWPRDFVGGLSTEMVEHFFRSLAESLGAAIHIEVIGENTHHMVEACFKGVGRALRQSLQLNDDGLPSTKGVL
ncbi:MAG: bifunctional histidinol-phosphatase/imidazoleglycerol-phosphate dehydratase HisB [Woeseiaceae bacterium]|nr:bifunctional histidinol-phosphatase/imidazoleglycerol-phosphate dehydratase HisB [Woeseiaceae bacterium]